MRATPNPYQLRATQLLSKLGRGLARAFGRKLDPKDELLRWLSSGRATPSPESWSEGLRALHAREHGATLARAGCAMLWDPELGESHIAPLIGWVEHQSTKVSNVSPPLVSPAPEYQFRWSPFLGLRMEERHQPKPARNSVRAMPLGALRFLEHELDATRLAGHAGLWMSVMAEVDASGGLKGALELGVGSLRKELIDRGIHPSALPTPLLARLLQAQAREALRLAAARDWPEGFAELQARELAKSIEPGSGGPLPAPSLRSRL